MQFFKVLRSWKRPVGVAVFPLVALMMTGFTNRLIPADRGVDRATLAADSRYMHQLFEKKRMPGSTEGLPIDLADPAQHRFLMNRLQSAGKTPKNSPRLFERLRIARERAVARAANPHPQDNAGLTTSAWGCQHFMIFTGETVAGYHNIESGPYATCVTGASYVYTDVVGYDANSTQTDLVTLEANAGEQYGEGTSFDDVLITPAMQARASRFFVGDSVMIAMNETTGEEVMTYSSLKTSGAGTSPQIRDVKHPTYAGSVAKKTVNSCQLRGELDCDYALVEDVSGTLTPWTNNPVGLALRKTDNPWTGDTQNFFPFPSGYVHDTDRVYIPVAFTFDAGTEGGQDCVVKQVLPGSRGRLTMKIQGGFCQTTEQPDAAGGNLSSALGHLLETNVADVKHLIGLPKQTMAVANGNGTTTVNCSMDPIENDTTNVYISVSVMADCGNGLVEKTAFYYGLGTTTARPNLYIRNSCMAEGTQIVHADGRSVPVEQVRVGDKVVVNDKGLELTVTGVAHGVEDEPLVRLRDSLGHDVRLTEEHPVVLASGSVVPAVKVKPQDRVRTRKGVSSIVTVERLAYDGKVYNLRLGTEEELAKVSPSDRTMFADGFLVGDSAMQFEVNQAKPDSRELMARLPKAWHQDYLKRVKSQKSAR